jgi:basic amino acid/polyamine antiporter, APA family
VTAPPPEPNVSPKPGDRTGALRRDLGVFGATMMGLGSIIGTGIFVSIGIAVGVAGPAAVLAIAIAAGLAVCNALSSAQLAANHPTSGGTYEYGYVYLTPWLGFTAGWMFLCAKSASAATAALGFAGYTFVALGAPDSGWRVALALAAVVVLVALVLSGLRRSSVTNIVIVSVTLLALATFVLAGLSSVLRTGGEHFTPFFESPLGDARSATTRLLEASALMFVAYTGYGRIATMGEEVREPRRTIPRAIVLTLAVSMTLYIAVGAVGVGAAGVSEFGAVGTERGAPLAVVARGFGTPGAGLILSIGAVTAMLGVLLNLVLGLSRVALAMGRRGDLPRLLARVNTAGTTPAPAVLLVGAVILSLAATGSIKLAWSFSAFTVLIYYAITNLAAIRLPRAQRLYHPAIAWLGLLGCLSLAFWVETRVCLAGLGVLALGLCWRAIYRALRRRPNP